jgi:hypothetical protein
MFSSGSTLPLVCRQREHVTKRIYYTGDMANNSGWFAVTRGGVARAAPRSPASRRRPGTPASSPTSAQTPVTHYQYRARVWILYMDGTHGHSIHGHGHSLTTPPPFPFSMCPCMYGVGGRWSCSCRPHPCPPCPSPPPPRAHHPIRISRDVRGKKRDSGSAVRPCHAVRGVNPCHDPSGGWVPGGSGVGDRAGV